MHPILQTDAMLKRVSTLIHDLQYPKPLFLLAKDCKQDATDDTIAKTDKHDSSNIYRRCLMHVHVYRSLHTCTCGLKAHIAGTCPLYCTLGICTSIFTACFINI